MFLVFVYGANLVSNYYTGDNVSYEMAVNNIFHLDALFVAVNIKPAFAYLALVLVYLGILTGYFTVSRHVVMALRDLVHLARKLQLFRTVKRSIVSLLAIVALAFGYVRGVIFLSSLVPGVGATRSEPILSLLTPSVPNSHAKLLPEEELARRQYPAPVNFQRKNVILITVDSLRADHLSLYGYARETTPFLSGLMK